MKTATLTVRFVSLVVAAFLLLSLSGCFSIYGRVNWDSYEKEAVRGGETSPVPKPLYMGLTNPSPPVQGHNVAILIPFIPILIAELPLEIAFDTLCLPYDALSAYFAKRRQTQNRLTAQTVLEQNRIASDRARLAEQTRILAPGKKARDISFRGFLPNVVHDSVENLKSRSLSEFRGKAVLLHFWCYALEKGNTELSGLTVLREIHQKFGEHITVLSLTDSGIKALDFAKAHGMTWETGMYDDANYMFCFDPKKTFYVLIDADGRIVAHSTEGVPLKPPESLPAVQSAKEALEVAASILTNSAPLQ